SLSTSPRPFEFAPLVRTVTTFFYYLLDNTPESCYHSTCLAHALPNRDLVFDHLPPPIRSFPDLYALCVSASSFPSLSPLPATLANCPQLHENTATLSPVFATLTDCVKHKSFVCHSYRKHGGWGYPQQNKFQSFMRVTNSTRGGETPCQLLPSCIDSSGTRIPISSAEDDRRPY